jgi:hypothetical protein
VSAEQGTSVVLRGGRTATNSPQGVGRFALERSDSQVSKYGVPHWDHARSESKSIAVGESSRMWSVGLTHYIT